MINRKMLKNNKKLAYNVSLLQGLIPGGRALVLHDFMPDLKGPMGGSFKITDFFHVVIAENEAAAQSVENPDIVIYQNSSPYIESVLHLDELASYENSLLCINYKAMKTYAKIGRPFPAYNINFLPADGEIGAEAFTTREIACGLCKNLPGAHLAKIMGCEQIYHTAHKKIDYEFLVNFVEKKAMVVPANLVRPQRQPILKTLL